MEKNRLLKACIAGSLYNTLWDLWAGSIMKSGGWTKNDFVTTVAETFV